MRISDGWQVFLACAFLCTLPLLIGYICVAFAIISFDDIGAFWLCGVVVQIIFPVPLTCLPFCMVLLEQLSDKLASRRKEGE